MITPARWDAAFREGVAASLTFLQGRRRGDLAHRSAGERSLHTREVQGSIPCAPTMLRPLGYTWRSQQNFRASTNERKDLLVALSPQFKLYVEKMSAILSPDGGKRFVAGSGNGALIKAFTGRACYTRCRRHGKDSGDTLRGNGELTS